MIDEHGIKVVYEESINDMLQLEEEMLKIGSYFINKVEIELYKNSTDSPLSMIDRGEVALNLFEKEFEL